MEYAVAVFVNRAQCQLFSRSLTKSGIPNSIISTPRDLGISCGISCKFLLTHMNVARNVLHRGNYTSFKNFYKVVPLSNSTFAYIKI